MIRSLLSICCAAVPAVVMAQEPLTNANFNPTVGTEFSIKTSAYDPPGPAGEAQTWNFSFLSPSASNDLAIVAPNTTPYAAQYPAANLAYSIDQGVAYNYYKIDSSAFNLVGQHEEGTIELGFDNFLALLPFPASLGISTSDTYAGSYTSGGVSGTITGDKTIVVDGSGSLVLPWGTVTNVFRLKRTGTQTEEFTNTTGTYTANSIDTTYLWVAPEFPYPLLIISKVQILIPELNVDQEQAFSQYISDVLLSAPERRLEADIHVFPNPASASSQILVNTAQPLALRVELCDMLGRSMREVYSGAISHSWRHDLQLSDMPAGLYLLRFSSAEAVHVERLVVK